ncbi:MAG: RecQ family ATP-dependent DNA helicase [Verrucomicrobiota bacterium]|nr:RecQ family ATP-dependent DNA helicase [Verrucomicrobiota bacterium]
MINNTYTDKLREIFGFNSFRKGQLEVIEALLAGNSALAVFPTGSGKSLCFQYASLFLPNLTVVVSPLIALMKDQVDFLQAKNIPAAKLDSTLSWNEVKQVYSDLRMNKLKLLYLAPERLSNEKFAHILESLNIDLMVIDEVHCISEWGHNFRPDYMKLARIAEQLSVGRVLGLTATATPSVVDDICKEFHIRKENYIHTGFYRPNLELRFTPCAESAKIDLLIKKIKEKPLGATIVYVTRQKAAMDLAESLTNAQIDACPYHGGMQNEQRHEIQDWFMKSKTSVVVATIAFGMGIDKADIRYVYHYNLAKSLENYSQEIGRAGRDGKASICEMFADSADIITLQNFTYGDTPDPDSIANLTNFILQQSGQFDVSLYELCGIYDMRNLVIKTFFTYLELLGVITHVSPFYSEYKVRFLQNKELICNSFNSQRASFLNNLFNTGKFGRTWLTINLKEAATYLGEHQSRISKALNYLEEQGFVTLKASGIRQIYRINNKVADSAILIKDLQARFMQREDHDVKMSNNIINLLKYEGCKVRFLLNFFGENFQKDCGHCEYCLTTADTSPVEHPEYMFTENDKNIVKSLKREFSEVFITNRKLTRFLCGITSPGTSRTRIPYITEDGKERKKALTKNPSFGIFAKVPFAKVSNWLNKLF